MRLIEITVNVFSRNTSTEESWFDSQ